VMTQALLCEPKGVHIAIGREIKKRKRPDRKCMIRRAILTGHYSARSKLKYSLFGVVKLS